MLWQFLFVGDPAVGEPTCTIVHPLGGRKVKLRVLSTTTHSRADFEIPTRILITRGISGVVQGRMFQSEPTVGLYAGFGPVWVGDASRILFEDNTHTLQPGYFANAVRYLGGANSNDGSMATTAACKNMTPVGECEVDLVGNELQLTLTTVIAVGGDRNNDIRMRSILLDVQLVS